MQTVSRLKRNNPPFPEGFEPKGWPKIVYIAKVGSLIKIGSTENMNARLKALKGELIYSFWTNERATESILLRWVTENGAMLAKGREWFDSIPDELLVVIKSIKCFQEHRFVLHSGHRLALKLKRRWDSPPIYLKEVYPFLLGNK